MKRLLKAIVVAILGSQVRRLQSKHQFKVIGVVGGIGKTSTKAAIARSLGATVRVRYQDGNYNDIVSVPLVFFGHALPSLLNPVAWFKLFLDNAKQIRGEYPFDVVVVELGTDRVGQIAAFKKYLQLDYAVVTAIVPEHMEFFKDMQTVANEELAVTAYAEKLIYNADLVAEEYRQPLLAATSYGSKRPADYRLTEVVASEAGFEATIEQSGKPLLHFAQDAISEVQLYSTAAAVVVGNELGLSPKQILDGIAAIQPVKGRLQRLRGINDSLIIDDTYNALPEAVKASLEMLYRLKAPQKIALLGSMNQLGAMSAEAHKEIGAFCDPAQLDLVVTIGTDAETHLAPAAAANGCKVASFATAHEAGEYLRTKIKKGAILLAKGSEANVYAEEAVKLLLADPKDAAKLVRQSAQWLKRKQKTS